MELRLPWKTKVIKKQTTWQECTCSCYMDSASNKVDKASNKGSYISILCLIAFWIFNTASVLWGPNTKCNAWPSMGVPVGYIVTSPGVVGMVIIWTLPLWTKTWKPWQEQSKQGLQVTICNTKLECQVQKSHNWQANSIHRYKVLYIITEQKILIFC